MALLQTWKRSTAVAATTVFAAVSMVAATAPSATAASDVRLMICDKGTYRFTTFVEIGHSGKFVRQNTLFRDEKCAKFTLRTDVAYNVTVRGFYNTAPSKSFPVTGMVNWKTDMPLTVVTKGTMTHPGSDLYFK